MPALVIASTWCSVVVRAGLCASSLPREPLTQESLQRIRAALREDMSPADALAAVTGETVGLFQGYYCVSKDGYLLNLCTGMHVHV